VATRPRISRRPVKVSAARSVFVGEHDRPDARRHRGIGRIGGAHLGRAVAVVDLPKAADATFVDRAEVMFAVWVVVLGEGVEGL
jgi:hypothetical protein